MAAKLSPNLRNYRRKSRAHRITLRSQTIAPKTYQQGISGCRVHFQASRVSTRPGKAPKPIFENFAGAPPRTPIISYPHQMPPENAYSGGRTCAVFRPFAPNFVQLPQPPTNFRTLFDYDKDFYLGVLFHVTILASPGFDRLSKTFFF